jgi:hypothetical protein
MEKCIHRSKQPLREYKHPNGKPCYSCGRDQIAIIAPYDPDGEIYAATGEEYARCVYYIPEREDKPEDFL